MLKIIEVVREADVGISLNSGVLSDTDVMLVYCLLDSGENPIEVMHFALESIISPVLRIKVNAEYESGNEKFIATFFVDSWDKVKYKGEDVVMFRTKKIDLMKPECFESHIMQQALELLSI